MVAQRPRAIENDAIRAGGTITVEVAGAVPAGSNNATSPPDAEGNNIDREGSCFRYSDE